MHTYIINQFRYFSINNTKCNYSQHNKITYNKHILFKDLVMQLEKVNSCELSIDHNSVNNLVPKAKKIKKPSLLKRKAQFTPIYNTIVIKKLYMIGDICLLNQDSVRNSQNNKESYIANNLFFTKITSINLNKQFFTMNVKRNKQNFLTSKYMIDRFKSFGDKQMKVFADNASDFIQQCELLQSNILKHQQQIGRENFLLQLNLMNKKRQEKFQQILDMKYKDMKYIALYHADGLRGMGLQKIVISNQMLKQAGLRISDLIQQYFKEKSLFFQLMGTGVYKDVFVKGCRQMADIMKQNRRQNKSILEYDPTQDQISDFTLNLPTQIYRKRHNGQVQWEQKVRCPMTFCKPRPYITVFLFGDAQQKPLAIMNQRTKQVQMMQFEVQPSIQVEMKKLKLSDEEIPISLQTSDITIFN